VNAFLATLLRELRLGLRTPAEIINPLFFFVLVVSLFPLGLSPEPELLRTIAPGVLWVAALLAVMLSLDNLFRQDHDSGTLEQLLCAPVALYFPVLARLLGHWLLTGLPLVLLSPMLGYMFHLPVAVLDELFFSLLLGTPTLITVGAIGAALTTGLRRGGMLLALLVLPLYVPVLIFGAGVVGTALEGYATGGVLLLLGAMLAAALGLGPLAVAVGLRISAGD
jgi:heme exporter protein B